MNSALDVLATIGATAKISSQVLQQIAEFVTAGLTDEVCDHLDDGVLMRASNCYLIFTDARPPEEWPLAPGLWTPTEMRSDFVKALALNILEIARLDRRNQ